MADQTNETVDETPGISQDSNLGDPSTTTENLQENENTVLSGNSEGKTGKITSDEKKRFLSNVVVNKGLEEAAHKIAEKMKDIDGGIQVVSVFPTVLDEFLLLDLRERINLLQSLLDDLGQRCHPYGDFEIPKIEWGQLLLNVSGDVIKRIEKEGTLKKDKIEKKIRAVDYAGIGSEISAGLGLISGTLSAVGDIIGYFRSDYSIKGQTVEPPSQFAIESIVANQLVMLDKEVYWVDFWQLQQSPLYQAYLTMVKKMVEVQQCTERIKTNTLDPLEDHIALLTNELNTLKTQWQIYINTPNESQINEIKAEILEISERIQKARKNHIPDSFYTELQTYLTTLHAKVADEILKISGNARENLETEINRIIQVLEQDEQNPPESDKKLSSVQKKSLNDQLTIYQKQLSEVIKNQGNNPLEELQKEINAVQKQLLYKPDLYIDDVEMGVLETRLKTCTEKLTIWQTGTETAARKMLEEKIEFIERLMMVDEKEYGKVKTLISEFSIIKTAADELVTLVSTIQPNTGISPLTRACLHECNFGERIKYLLKINLVAADADVFEEDPSIFVRFPTISYSGGAVINYVLLTKQGRVISSGTASAVSVLDQKVGREPKKSNLRLDGKQI